VDSAFRGLRNLVVLGRARTRCSSRSSSSKFASLRFGTAPARPGTPASPPRPRVAARRPIGFAGMLHGTHDFLDDAPNECILIWVNGELVPRERAVVSVFDAGFVLGDGVWEGLRVRAGHPAFLERHLDRLFEGAKTIMLDVGHSRRELTEAIYSTLQANDMD